MAANIILIILDCARFDESKRSESNLVHPFPNLDWLRQESVDFQNAVSVSNWTLPSHASVFSGAYPWTHGVHTRSELQLNSRRPVVTETLERCGYHTIALSANGLIDSQSGMLRGFNQTRWGTSVFDRLPRWLPERVKREDELRGAGGGKSQEKGSTLRLGSGFQLVTSSFLSRYPSLWDIGLRSINAIPGGSPSHFPTHSPWIEGVLDDWLSHVEPSRPVFAFVNLLEGHEPYIFDRIEAGSSHTWLEYARTPQDRASWVSGRSELNKSQWDLLHRLYRLALKKADARVGNIINILVRHHRWKNSLVIVTSDHGQSFGEDGLFFHVSGSGPAEVSIPLIIKFPQGEGKGSRQSRTVSLVDLAPTMLDAAGLLNGDEDAQYPSSPAHLEGVRLAPGRTKNWSDSRDGVFAMSDGHVSPIEQNGSSASRASLVEAIEVSYYAQGLRLVAQAKSNGEVQSKWLGPNGASIPQDSKGILDGLVERVSQLSKERSNRDSKSVRARLLTWGY